MPISAKSASWAPIVQQELSSQGIPLPIELILAVIDIESQGVPGIENEKSGASGLMQVMPVVVEDYNNAHKQKTSIERMRDPNLGKEQIKVGIWILGQFWKGAYSYLKKRLTTVPIDELMKIADLFYVAGPGAAKKRLNKLSVPSWNAVQSSYPEWNALPHTKKAIEKTEGVIFDLDSIGKWLEGAVGKIDQKKGVSMAVVIIAAGMLLMRYLNDKEKK